MRRPSLTAPQRQHAREQRAMLRLRRAAVRYSVGMDDPTLPASMLFADLQAACDAYTNALGARERRRLCR